MPTIEILPNPKSCERGCRHCNNARNNKVLDFTGIDPNVQETFSLIESFLKKGNLEYTLGNNVPSMGTPINRFPELVKMMGFQTNEFEIGKGLNIFSEKIRNILESTRIDPEVLYLNIENIFLLNENSAMILEEYIIEFSKWYFKSENKTFNLLIDSDFPKGSKIDDTREALFNSDIKHLKSLAKKYSEKPLYGSENEIYVGSTYMTYYESTLGKNKILMSHRAILQAEKPKFDQLKNYNIEQVRSYFPNNMENLFFFLAPHGVMFSHSTLNINNPILWLSNKDFRDSLTRMAKKETRDLFLLNFVQEIINQNKEMYIYLQNEFGNLKNEVIMRFFEENRYEFFKPISFL